jgi:hypothetical protein
MAHDHQRGADNHDHHGHGHGGHGHTHGVVDPSITTTGEGLWALDKLAVPTILARAHRPCFASRRNTTRPRRGVFRRQRLGRFQKKASRVIL